MKKKLKNFIPKTIKRRLRSGILLSRDIKEFLVREPLIPPRKLRMMVGPFPDKYSYKTTQEEFFKYFRDLCCVKPNERILDIGCGCGQMAAPLTKYLSPGGSYEGFDISNQLIDWSRRNISSKYPNFHFELADLFSKRYNPKGRYQPSEYQFPYEKNYFDFAFAKSVFTHMFPKDVENYFSNVSHVLKKGGRCLFTFFLLNAESSRLIDARVSTLDFKHDFGQYRTVDVNSPEAAVCLEEPLVLGFYEKYKLRIEKPICYGSWCGRSNFMSYQDMVIAYKE